MIRVNCLLLLSGISCFVLFVFNQLESEIIRNDNLQLSKFFFYDCIRKDIKNFAECKEKYNDTNDSKKFHVDSNYMNLKEYRFLTN